LRRALADTVQTANSLKNTADITQQWQKLLIEPLGKSSESIVGPIVIMIDALDESGGAETRIDLLRILAGKHRNPAVPKITDLPANFRFIVTSRPLDDINDVFHGVQHIQHMSMDDIPPAFAERDIRAYVSTELKGLDLQDRNFAVLAEKADGLFEWARLACGYIKESHLGLSSIDCYNAVVSRNPAERNMLLHDMYHFILTDIMPKDTSPHSQKPHATALARFRSVMGQILSTAEPLPLASLNAMRRHFPTREDNFDVELVIKNMGPLLSGTTNPDSRIRPLHTSFHDFLTDERFSQEFFIDLSKAQRDLAFASLRVMEHGLRFNICDLKSSYLPNSEDAGLQERIQKCIPPHLSYSSRFWTWHVRTTTFDMDLAKEVKLLFDHERVFFWLESLALTNALGGAVSALPPIAQWLKGDPEFKDVVSTAMDVQRFIQVFGGMILYSTPHLYVSALPFSPANSPLSRQFAVRFPNILRVASGRDINWPAVQAVLRGHTSAVLSVSFSPDGTRIITGSYDGTLRLWDAGTGEPIGEPLRGHTGSVWSVSFSPDGTHIVTGSSDKTVRLWDAGTREAVGDPLRGHTSSVWSVSFSPDGTRIVTGSRDKTVRLWDAGTGEPVGEPLRGHTGSVSSVLFSPDGTRIVTGSDDKTARLWDAGTREPIGKPLRGHTSSVRSVSFSPDGTRIVTGSSDHTVRLWNAETGEPVGEPLRGHTGSVMSASFSPDGTRIVTGSYDGTAWLWDAGTGEPIGEPLRGHTDSVLSISFSPDGTRIVTGSDDKTVRLWDAGMGEPIGEPLRGHTSSVRSVSFSPDGTRIVTISGDNTIWLWDAGRGEPVGEPLRRHTDSAMSASFSPDGTRIVTGSYDGTVRLWDAGTGEPIGEPLRGHTGVVWSVSFSPDGTRIVTGSDDKTVRLWDAVMRQPLQQCAASDPSAFSYNHPTIAATTTMPLNIWNNHLIRFSSNAIHALRDTSELTEGASHDDHSSTPFFLDRGSGWVVGPQDRLLFWVPPSSRDPFYNPATVLVIPRGCPELDLSRMAHGQHWQKCREAP
jgi:WD40 repeat protein